MALTRHYIRMDLAFVGDLGRVMTKLKELELCASDLNFEHRGGAVGTRESEVAGPKLSRTAERFDKKARRLDRAMKRSAA